MNTALTLTVPAHPNPAVSGTPYFFPEGVLGASIALKESRYTPGLFVPQESCEICEIYFMGSDSHHTVHAACEACAYSRAWGAYSLCEDCQEEAEKVCSAPYFSCADCFSPEDLCGHAADQRALEEEEEEEREEAERAARKAEAEEQIKAYRKAYGARSYSGPFFCEESQELFCRLCEEEWSLCEGDCEEFVFSCPEVLERGITFCQRRVLDGAQLLENDTLLCLAQEELSLKAFNTRVRRAHEELNPGKTLRKGWLFSFSFSPDGPYDGVGTISCSPVVAPALSVALGRLSEELDRGKCSPDFSWM